MRDKEKKHRKGQESTIGKIIYGFLLFMPLIAIGVTCGYAMFNKNAYQSYATTYSESFNKVTGINDFLEDYTYTIKYENKADSSSSGRIAYSQCSVNWLNLGFEDRNYMGFEVFGNGIIRAFYTDNDFIQKAGYWGTTLNEFTFTFDYFITQPSTFPNSNSNFYYVISAPLKLNDAFYYAVDKVTESPLFNWAQNSVIYTTTNTTCNALSITTPFIPLLLSYWLIISVIYFLYDIALMLVWLIHRKIHELQESL